MKIPAVFVLTFLTSLLLAFAQASDEANAVLQAERDLATAYLKSDAHAIAQGVMEDYTLINSMGKITTRADDIDEAKKNDPKYEIFENYEMKVRVHGDTAVVAGKTRKRSVRRKTVRFPVSIYRHIRERQRTLAFARRPCL
jgi:ketosteroid isomerase-like protein